MVAVFFSFKLVDVTYLNKPFRTGNRNILSGSVVQNEGGMRLGKRDCGGGRHGPIRRAPRLHLSAY